MKIYSIFRFSEGITNTLKLLIQDLKYLLCDYRKTYIATLIKNTSNYTSIKIAYVMLLQ